MKNTIPLLPLPYRIAKKIIRGYYPVAALASKFFPSLELELEESESSLSPKEYLGGAFLAFTFYFAALFFILAAYAYRKELLSDAATRAGIVFASFLVSGCVFSYIMLFPRWVATKKKLELEKNLLFAMRHLTIQTAAGVPLFSSIVSISEDYESPEFNYGEISREFRRITKEVRGGKELTEALEESASRSSSHYYRRVMWQLASANNAGANIGFVLRDLVEFLSNEQRIMIRNYGSQLNPLALLYMLTCIIAPTMGLVFLSIAATLVDIPVNEITMGAMLIGVVVTQIMFLGLIKSRRPTVSI